MPELLDVLPVIIVERRTSKLGLAVALSGIIAFVTALSLLLCPPEYLGRESAAPFKESEYGALAAVLNVVLMVCLVAVLTLLLVLLLRKGKLSLVRALIVLSVSFASGWAASFVLLWWLILVMALVLCALGISVEQFAAGHATILMVTLHAFYYAVFVAFAVLTGLALTNRLSLRARNLVLLLSATWIGAILAFTLGWLTPIVLLAAFAFYDIYAVYRGPLRKLCEVLSEDRSVTEARGLALGAGDILFYSLAIAYAMQISWLCSLVVLVICVCGSTLTVYLLLTRGDRMAPALPVPILLALLAILIFSLW